MKIMIYKNKLMINKKLYLINQTRLELENKVKYIYIIKKNIDIDYKKINEGRIVYG